MRKPQAARLLALVRDAPGTRLLLLGRGEVAVGSAQESALQVADASVASLHAIITHSRGRYYVADLKSAEGTLVNGKRIRRRQRLKHGDVVRFGRAPGYRFIDPDAQSRRRWRRNLRVVAIVAVLFAAALADHFENWGLFSSATVMQIVAWTELHARSLRAEAPTIQVASAPSPAIVATPLPTRLPEVATLVPTAPATVAPTIIGSPRPHRTAHASPRATPAPVSVKEIEIPAAVIPTALPTPAEMPAATSSSVNWLSVLNAYRARLNVPPVTEDPTLSAGCLAHAKYLVTNYHRSFATVGALMHSEDPSKPGYSPDGLKAARSSDVLFEAMMHTTSAERLVQAIQVWIDGPFHRLQLLNPNLQRAGFGESCEGTLCVLVLDPVSDLPLTPPGGREFAEPIKVPPDGATVKPSGFNGEWPDPLSACPSYSDFVLAITLNLGMYVPATITDASLTQTTGAAAGTKVETCAYDSQTYTNPDPDTQAHGRLILHSFGEAVMMLRNPLASGETYRVAMKVNGRPYNWSFTAAK
jgi:uncharacterized protein YkwD